MQAVARRRAANQPSIVRTSLRPPSNSWPVRSETNAMRAPFGDHCGSVSFQSSPKVICFARRSPDRRSRDASVVVEPARIVELVRRVRVVPNVAALFAGRPRVARAGSARGTPPIHLWATIVQFDTPFVTLVTRFGVPPLVAASQSCALRRNARPRRRIACPVRRDERDRRAVRRPSRRARRPRFVDEASVAGELPSVGAIQSDGTRRFCARSTRETTYTTCTHRARCAGRRRARRRSSLRP